jgi:hypothetical protein
VAQRIRHLTTDQGIPGPNPGRVALLLFFFSNNYQLHTGLHVTQASYVYRLSMVVKARKRESGIKRDSEANLRVVLDEEEEHHILAKVLDGQVERVLCAGLEHVVQQWGTQVRKVPRVQIVLWGEHGSIGFNTTSSQQGPVAQ